MANNRTGPDYLKRGGIEIGVDGAPKDPMLYALWLEEQKKKKRKGRIIPL